MRKVYIVGAGPGDPDLITVKGMKCIQKADVILYDRLINKGLLDYARPEADLIYCGKLPNDHTMKQETINHFLIKHAQGGKTVTRLKGGDPFIFGRGAEEAEALAKHAVDFEIIPGITSGIAAPAYAGIPLTHRDFSGSVAFVTGHRQSSDAKEICWESMAKGIDTLAIYMGVKNLPYISAQLLKYGRNEDTPVALVHWGTTEEQQTVTGTLGNIADKARQSEVKTPTLIVVGEVVQLREQIKWFEQLGESALLSS